MANNLTATCGQYSIIHTVLSVLEISTLIDLRSDYFYMTNATSNSRTGVGALMKDLVSAGGIGFRKSVYMYSRGD